MEHELTEKLTTVEIWDNNQNLWEEYDCPGNSTVGEYAEWCIAEESPTWATITNEEDAPIRLNGWYIVDPFNVLLGERTACISLDNGNSFRTVEDLSDEEIADNWSAIEHFMEDDIRSYISYKFAPCPEREFLTVYLEMSKENLIIG